MVLLAAGLWISTHATSEQGDISLDKNRAVVVRANSRISVDGSLKDTDWERAQLIGEIMQREPREGTPATERTVVRLLYDSDNLYVGVHFYDCSSPGHAKSQFARM